MHNSKKQIAILGDSLALHREIENINSTQTYPFLLGNTLGNDFFVINRARRSNHILKQMLLDTLYDDVTDETQYCILQLGIVDCHPRIFSEEYQNILYKMKDSIFKKLLINFASKHRYILTKLFPKTYVKYDDFRFNYENIVRYILKKKNIKKVLLLNIAKPHKSIAQRSFKVIENIKKYNEGIKEIETRYDRKVKIIDFYSLTEKEPDLLLADGQHISIKGHKVLAKMLSEEIKTTENLQNTDI